MQTINEGRKVPRWVVVVGVLAALAVVGSLTKRGDSSDTGTSSSSEAMRLRWNRMNRSDQVATCVAVHDSGAGATALALRWPESMDDIKWFLTELAC